MESIIKVLHTKGREQELVIVHISMPSVEFCRVVDSSGQCAGLILCQEVFCLSLVSLVSLNGVDVGAFHQSKHSVDSELVACISSSRSLGHSYLLRKGQVVLIGNPCINSSDESFNLCRKSSIILGCRYLGLQCLSGSLVDDTDVLNLDILE